MLRDLIATTQDAVVFIDGGGRIMLFNPAAERVFGYEAGEVLGHKVNMLMASPFREEHDGYLARYEQTGDKRAIGRIRTVQGCRKNGEEFPIELSVTELSGRGRTRYAAFIRDISETVALQDQLVERERLAAVGSSAAMLAHEIANPLNNMHIQAEVMRRGIRDDEALRERFGEDIDAIMAEIQRLARLLEEFRALSRRDRGGHALTLLGPLVHAVTRQLGALARSKGVTILPRVEDEVPGILGSADKLQQALVNLVKNSIEAALDGGSVELRLVRREDQVILKVVDSGTGIPGGFDVFEPFQTTKPEGTGLGLSIVKQIVLAHRGSIDWESAPGEGTTFTLIFPVPAERAMTG